MGCNSHSRTINRLAFTSIIPNQIDVIRPRFQASAAPRHWPYCRPLVHTIAPGAPTLLNGAEKFTLIGNLGLIALLKFFLKLQSKGQKS